MSLQPSDMTIMSLLWDVVCFTLHVTELRLGAYLPSVTHSCLMYLLGCSELLLTGCQPAHILKE